MRSLWGKKLAVALISVGGGAGLATVAAAGHDAPDGPDARREMVVTFDAGDGDSVEIDDLDQLEVGDSRTYRTSSGKPVTVTRDDKGYELELDGKKLRIGGLLDGEGHGALLFGGHPGAKMKMRHIELDGDGDAKSFVITDDPEHDVLLREGPGGEHGLMYRKMALPPHGLMVDGLIERLEKSEKFRSLDDATQDLVREAIRESAPEADWIGIRTPGDSAMKIMVRERKPREESDDRRK
jgi:hypothetical protein